MGRDTSQAHTHPLPQDGTEPPVWFSKKGHEQKYCGVGEVRRWGGRPGPDAEEGGRQHPKGTRSNSCGKGFATRPPRDDTQGATGNYTQTLSPLLSSLCSANVNTHPVNTTGVKGLRTQLWPCGLPAEGRPCPAQEPAARGPVSGQEGAALRDHLRRRSGVGGRAKMQEPCHRHVCFPRGFWEGCWGRKVPHGRADSSKLGRTRAQPHLAAHCVISTDQDSQGAADTLGPCAADMIPQRTPHTPKGTKSKSLSQDKNSVTCK